MSHLIRRLKCDGSKRYMLMAQAPVGYQDTNVIFFTTLSEVRKYMDMNMKIWILTGIWASSQLSSPACSVEIPIGCTSSLTCSTCTKTSHTESS